jgi:hypothetical protein
LPLLGDLIEQGKMVSHPQITLFHQPSEMWNVEHWPREGKCVSYHMQNKGTRKNLNVRSAMWGVCFHPYFSFNHIYCISETDWHYSGKIRSHNWK